MEHKWYSNWLHSSLVTTEFDAEEKFTDSFMLASKDRDNGEHLWVAKLLILFSMYGSKERNKKRLAFVQCMECTPGLDAEQETMRCVCLRQSTDDEKDQSVLAIRGVR